MIVGRYVLAINIVHLVPTFALVNDTSVWLLQEDAGTFGIYKLFWIFLNSYEFDDLPLFLVSEECVSKRLPEN